jgi:UDP-N-acetylmuramoyl-L-alanyl-D-glutamate--2,6-diaminopimelate ligase
MLLLTDLLRQITPLSTHGHLPQMPVTGIQEDSRLIQAGNVFIARGGAQTDGRKFLDQAKSRGAIAVITPAYVADCDLPQVVVTDAALAASFLANAFYGNPSRQLKTIGITGTNGKTTTAYLLRHVLNHFNLTCGLIGTVEIDDGKDRWESTMTTPGPIEVAKLLARMRDQGCKACAMETSSHALHQSRVAGVHYAGAVFTNLTLDHSDYHPTMEDYAAAKARLFEMLTEDSVAVVNAADPWTSRIIRDTKARIVRFGFTAAADYRAADVSITANGSRFILHTPDGNAEMNLQLIGKHNIENTLAACAILGEVFHLNVHQLASGFKQAVGAPGRLQSVRAGQPFAVLVDYAHTDDALKNVLTALRPLTKNRLRVLFGCGGDRDRRKRPRMARIAEQLADVIYVTSDNPRTENPQSILDEICTGFTAEVSRPRFVDIDRRAAIARILADSEPGDVVLIAGKGHENYQIIGSTKHHFDDVEECVAALQGKSVAA